jgi:hypothetical protein
MAGATGVEISSDESERSDSEDDSSSSVVLFLPFGFFFGGLEDFGFDTDFRAVDVGAGVAAGNAEMGVPTLAGTYGWLGGAGVLVALLSGVFSLTAPPFFFGPPSPLATRPPPLFFFSTFSGTVL